MYALRFESPLAWPESIAQTPHTQQRTDHGFPMHMALDQSILFINEELRWLDVGSAVLSLDIEQPMVERLRRKVGSRTGACLHFMYQNKGYVLACDRWQAPEHNIYALHLGLRQWRNMERWGLGTLPMLMSGFEVNKVPQQEIVDDGTPKSWMEFLGLGPTATLEDAVAVYHRRAKLVGRNTEELARLNAVMDQARAYFARKVS